jgi:hypothetical protein
MDPFLLRVIERILAVAIGGLSIVLGYRLFIQLPDQKDSAGKITLPGDISVYLSRVGPGVFFSLFGAAIVVMSLQNGLSVNRKSSENATPAATQRVAEASYSYLTGDRKPDPEERAALRADARNAIAQLNAMNDLVERAQPDRRTGMRLAIRDAKLALMANVWADDWGDKAAFRNWVNAGESEPPPAHADDAVRMFRQTRE